MKKQYIQPESRVVVVKLFGAVLDTDTHFGNQSQATDWLSRESEDKDRFDWDNDNEEDW